MNTNSEIITMFEYLFDKLGIAVDFADDNIIPYIKDLSMRYCSFRMQWNIVGIITSIIFAIIFAVIGINVYRKTHDEDDCFGYFIFCIIAICVMLYNIYMFIKCKNIPDVIFYEYIMNLTKK